MFEESTTEVLAGQIANSTLSIVYRRGARYSLEYQYTFYLISIVQEQNFIFSLSPYDKLHPNLVPIRGPYLAPPLFYYGWIIGRAKEDALLEEAEANGMTREEMVLGGCSALWVGDDRPSKDIRAQGVVLKKLEAIGIRSRVDLVLH